MLQILLKDDEEQSTINFNFVNEEDVKEEEDDEEIGFSGFEIMKKIQELCLSFFFLYKK
jgi:hypothetical protein